MDVSVSNPPEIANLICEDVHLYRIASLIVTWEELAPHFGLWRPEIEAIRKDNACRYQVQKIAFLLKWKEKQGSNATFGALVRKLHELEQRGLAEKVVAIASESPSCRVNTAVSLLRAYLQQCYMQQQPPSATQWPYWPRSVFIEPSLALAVEEESSEDDKDDDKSASQKHKNIKLGDVFTAGLSPTQRRVLLIEAPAGSGKTTLAWYMKQKWADGELFREFELLINIPLGDQTTQSARCLKDIIPHPTEEIRSAVATHVEKVGGNGVAFIMDSWDEMFSGLHVSYIFDLVFGTPGKCLPDASILIMSRSVCDVPLYSAISRKFIIERFSAAQVKKYLNGLLSATPQIQASLPKILEERPIILDLCHLPINASIIAFLLSRAMKHIPENRTGLYKLLILNLLLRHVRRLPKYKEFKVLRRFEDLPSDMHEKFVSLCNAAYVGVTEESSVFDWEEFEELDVDISEEADTFGLVEIRPAFSAFGESVQYSFLHQGIQCFLAAMHMSELPEEHQYEAVEVVMRKNNRNLVLPFFAGITKLHDLNIFDLLLQAAVDPISVTRRDSLRVVSLPKPEHHIFNIQQLQLLLLNCICETDSNHLCRTAAEQLIANSIDGQISLTFHNTVLDPSDYIAIGYFLANMSTSAGDVQVPGAPPTSSRATISVNLSCSWCSTHDSDVALLFRHPLRDVQTLHSQETQLHIELEGNEITHKGTEALGLLVCHSSIVRSLNLFGNWKPSGTNVQIALQHLRDALANNSSLTSLSLSTCNITETHAEILADILVQCRGLHDLDLSYNDIGPGVGAIAGALCKNTSLSSLNLEQCDLTDDSLLALGRSLNTNKFLKKLDVSFNQFSSSTISDFLELLKHQSHLQELTLSSHSTAGAIIEHQHIVQEINTKRTNIPELQLKIM